MPVFGVICYPSPTRPAPLTPLPSKSQNACTLLVLAFAVLLAVNACWVQTARSMASNIQIATCLVQLLFEVPPVFWDTQVQSSLSRPHVWRHEHKHEQSGHTNFTNTNTSSLDARTSRTQTRAVWTHEHHKHKHEQSGNTNITNTNTSSLHTRTSNARFRPQLHLLFHYPHDIPAWSV
jgi:hypothetical protein